MSNAPYMFILSWERPTFLWATLDSIYRNTRRDLNIVLIDNNSQDPGVHDVIDGFSRRDMFLAVHRCNENRSDRMNRIFREYRSQLGSYFFFCESDVVVPEAVCWASEYEKILQKYPDTAMVGSFCDKRDFIDSEVIRAHEPELSDEQVEFFSKTHSPERQVVIEPGMDIWPHSTPNPPGRLTLLSTAAVDEVGIHPDSILASKIGDHGFRHRICTTFTHRHLSLMNWYDVSDRSYAKARQSFFGKMYPRKTLSSRAVRKIKRLVGRPGA